jgi:periodic tryptophan protein 2
LAIDDEGKAVLINLLRRVVLSHFDFKSRVYALAFSPNGRFFAVSNQRNVRVWRTPGLFKEFAPFELVRTFTGMYDDVIGLDWSLDSRFFLATSKDTTVRVFAMERMPGFVPPTLSGHRDAVKGGFFSRDGKAIYTVSKDGALFRWSYVENEDNEQEHDDGDDGDDDDDDDDDKDDDTNALKIEVTTDSEGSPIDVSESSSSSSEANVKKEAYEVSCCKLY